MRLSYYISSMTNAFSFEQQAVIEGSLLGDGHLTKPRGKGNSAFSKTQTARRREYLDWSHDLLGDYSSSVNEYDSWAKGKKYRKSKLICHALPVFTELRNKWYPDGIKIVPRDIVLSPLSIAIWFFDDGSNYVPNRQCKFATYSFTTEDCEVLCKQLMEHKINSYITPKNIIQVRTSSYKTLVDLVRPYMIWDFFKHKIQYRDSELKFTTSDEANEMQKLYSGGMKQTDIAEKLGKSLSVVSNVLRGKRKVSISKECNLSLGNTSGIKGVSWDRSRNKWLAFKRANGKTKNLGRFNTKEEAERVVLVGA